MVGLKIRLREKVRLGMGGGGSQDARGILRKRERPGKPGQITNTECKWKCRNFFRNCTETDEHLSDAT